MFSKSSLLSLLAVLGIGLAASAAEVRGIIIKVDAGKYELTLEGRGRGVRGKSLTFRLDPKAEIVAGTQPGKMADLVAGKRVRVVYEMQGNERVAVRITLPGEAIAPVTVPAPIGANAVAGTLRRVALTDREIVVISPGSKGGAEIETTIAVPDSAKITRDQQAIRLEDLREGMQVVVQTEKKDRQLIAKSIQIGAAAPLAPEAGRETRIERIRQILKMIDAALQRIEDR